MMNIHEHLDASPDPDVDADSLLALISPVARQRTIPHLGDALIFALLAAFFIFVTEATFFGLAVSLQLLPHESAARLAHEPKLILPAMALSYLLTLGTAWLVFSALWERSFAQGIHWCGARARTLRWRLIPAGLALGLLVQFLQNYLPMPKTVPMDDFFKSRNDVWMVTVFGTLLAPLFEEIAFRGMLLPAFANAWDWLQKATRPPRQTHAMVLSGDTLDDLVAEPQHDSATPNSAQPSRQGLIYSAILTSMLFALLHSDQLAHSFAPLALLFCVSLVLTYIRVSTGSVAASALVHASYNFVVFLTIFIGTDGYRHLEKLKT